MTWEEKAFLISCIKIQGVTAHNNQRSRDAGVLIRSSYRCVICVAVGCCIWFVTMQRKKSKGTSAAARVCFVFVWRGSSVSVWSVYRTLKIPLCCISTDSGPVVSFVYMASWDVGNPGWPHGKEQPQDAKDFQLPSTGKTRLWNMWNEATFKPRLVWSSDHSPLWS